MSDAGLFELIKDWIIVPSIGIATWAWSHNESDHKSIKEFQEKLRDKVSLDHSRLNEKLMGHIESRVNEAIKLARDDDKRIMDHMANIALKLDEHSRRSEDRHVEMLNAIHQGLSKKADK